MQEFTLRDEYITLGQFLKEIGEIGTGGAAKWYLQEVDVLVNGEIERRRGKKLYANDEVQLPDNQSFIIIGQSDEA